MPEGVIGMEDMETVFAVTDALGIHRESVRVELAKEDPGSIGRQDNGIVEITLPASESTESFCQRLQAELESLGYQPTGDPLDEDEDGF